MTGTAISDLVPRDAPGAREIGFFVPERSPTPNSPQR